MSRNEEKDAPKYSERIDGPTPNGGAYAIAFYMDQNGNRTDVENAVKGEIVEYDSNDIEICRTYANFQ